MVQGAETGVLAGRYHAGMIRGREVLESLLRLLAPPCCAACGLELLCSEDGFCGGCAVLLDEVPSALRPPRPAAAGFVYGGPLAEAVQRMKYERRPDIAIVLGRRLAEVAEPYAGLVDVTVPMPLHPARLRERGFNQSALLARPVARALGVPLDTALLLRTRPTAVQASLPRERRVDNVRGAFTVARTSRPRRVLLIDDVRTTGATLASAAAALLDAGHSRVFTLALARAEA